MSAAALRYAPEFDAPAINHGSLNDLMDQMGVRIPFARNDEIYAQDDDAAFLYRVVKGAVRTTRLMTDGRRQIGDFYYPGDVFGVEPVTEHLFCAETLCDSVILVGKRTRMRDASRGRMDHMIWGAASEELRRAHEHVLLLGQKTACERVATLLLNLADRSCEQQIAVPMSRLDMADYLGLTIETVSRMLTQLQASGIVEFSSLRDFQVKNHGALARLTQ